MSENLIFGPNESRKTVTIPITNDQLYYGPRYYPLEFANPTGGLLTDANAIPWPTLLIIDDDSQPILSLVAAMSVQEGNGGLTPFSIPVQLSAQMLIDVTASVSFENGTATLNDFVPGSGGLRIRAGETAGVISGAIKGDVMPEPDETFTIRLIPLNTNNDPKFGNATVVVTIVNDDSAASAAIPALSSFGMFLLGVVLVTAALRVIR